MKIAIISVLFFASLLLAPWAQANPGEEDLEATFGYEVLGWSEDSHRWGFRESGDYGSGMLYSPGGGLYVIDAARNAFVFDHFNVVGELEDHDAERADRIAGQWEREDRDAARDFGLHGNEGTVVYRAPKMVWMTYDTRFKQFGRRDLAFAHKGRNYEVRLRDSILDDPRGDTMAGKRSKFSVSIRRAAGAWHLLQEDRSHWRPFMAYRIVYVSISPDAKKVAVLVEAVENALERQKQAYYRGVTGLLP